MCKKTIGYIRVSTEQQVKDGESLERQLEQIQAYCKYQGIDNVEIISDEGISGYKDESKREGFNQVLELIKSGEVESLIVYDISRLSRSTRKILEIFEDVIQKNNVNFVSLREKIETGSAMGKAFLTLIAMFSQLYRDEISEKVKRAIHHKREKGEKITSVTAWGYTETEGKLTINEEELKTIQYIKKLRDAGTSEYEISDILRKEGYKTRQNNSEWTRTKVRSVINSILFSKYTQALPV